MLITRHNVLSKDMQNFITKLTKFGYNMHSCKQYLTNLIEANEYIIYVSCNNNILTIKYKYARFSIEDLKNTHTCVYGNGKEDILKAYDKGLLEYEYLDGYNIYRFKVTGDNDYATTYTVKGHIDYITCHVHMDIIRKTDEDWIEHDWSFLVLEVVYNIIHYTNIKYKTIPKFVVIVGLLFRGLFPPKRYKGV